MGKEFDIKTSEDKLSRINSAGLINITLENLWKDCYNAMARGQLDLWNIKLDAIWLILGGDAVDKDKEINDIDISIYELGTLRPPAYSGFEKEINPNATKQYLLLKKKSLFLRRLQNTQGKGTAYITEDDFDFE
jgi:hypothetical protein